MNHKRRSEQLFSSILHLPPSVLTILLLSIPAVAFSQDPAPERESPELTTGETRAENGNPKQEAEADEAEGAADAKTLKPTDRRDPEAVADDPASLDAARAVARSEKEDESDEALSTGEDTPTERRSIAPRSRRARGFAFRLEGGRALWRLDAEQIQNQLNPQMRPEVQTLMVDGTHDAPAVTMHLAYNFLGHATLGAELTATGWNVFSPGRGGGGLAAFTVAWHPAELLAELLPIGLLRQRAWDVSLFGGAGWGAVGKDRALRGMHTLMGARAEIYLAPWLAIGASVKRHGLQFSEYVIHWDNDQFVTLPDTSGGSLLVPSISIALRVPTGS